MIRYIIYGLIGLACFIMLAMFCIDRHAVDIQSRTADRVRESLKKQGFEWVGVNANGRRVVLTGKANDDTTHQAVKAIVAGVPGVSDIVDQINVTGGLSSAVINVTPYRTEFSINDDKLVLHGAVPDLSAKNRLIAIAKQRFPSDRIDDQMVVAKTAPSQWSTVAEFTISELIKFNTGSVEIMDTTITISGSTGQQTEITHGRSEIESKLPDSFNLIYDIQVEEPQIPDDNRTDSNSEDKGPVFNTSRKNKCIEYLNQIQNQFVIRFQADKSDLSIHHHQYLDGLSKQLINCADVNIEIRGHADSQGSAEYNRKLSLKRAQAVMNYLQQNSVDSSQLLVTGYGEDKPVASNDDEHGRKQNRRVEFNIQETGR